MTSDEAFKGTSNVDCIGSRGEGGAIACSVVYLLGLQSRIHDDAICHEAGEYISPFCGSVAALAMWLD